MRSACLVLMCTLAAGLTACGTSDREQVRSTLERFQQATLDKDYQELCDDVFANRLVEQVRSIGLPCEVALKRGLGDLREPTLTIEGIEVADDEALARVRSGAAGQRPSEDTIRLVKEDGEWHVASLAAPQPQPPPVTAP